MRLCRRCGATLSDRIDWCGQCGSRAAAISRDDLVDDLAAVWSPYVPPPASRREPRPVRRLSRIRGGAVSPGPLGRGALTTIVGGGWLAALLMLLLTTIGPVLVMAYVVITLPGTWMILRDVWKPDLIVEPPPPASECGACGALRRQGARACHVCFAAYDAAAEKTYSRTVAGPTAFGPLGRWLFSMGVFVGYGFGAIFSANLGYATLAVFTGAYAIIAWKILRPIWARARVA